MNENEEQTITPRTWHAIGAMGGVILAFGAFETMRASIYATDTVEASPSILGFVVASVGAISVAAAYFARTERTIVPGAGGVLALLAFSLARGKFSSVDEVGVACLSAIWSFAILAVTFKFAKGIVAIRTFATIAAIPVIALVFAFRTHLPIEGIHVLMVLEMACLTVLGGAVAFSLLAPIFKEHTASS